MPRRIPTQQQDVPVDFPVRGLDLTQAFAGQKPFTTRDAKNVRSIDPRTDRARGGSRPGLSRFCPDQINYNSARLPYSIQDIVQIVSGTPEAEAAAGRFTYAFAGGFGLGSPAGASYFTDNSGGSKFNFECSCWDSTGHAYAGLLNPEAGEVTILKADSAGSGSLSWQLQGGAITQSENVAGMVVHGDWLYVAIAHSAGAVARIWRVSTATGEKENGTTPWVSSATLSGLTFTTAPANNLAVIGDRLGVAVRGTAANADDNFYVLDTGTGVLKASTGSQGTSSGTTTRVDQDGAHFYLVTHTTARKVQKVSPGGTVVWTYAVPAGDNDNMLAYCRVKGVVYVLGRTTGTLRVVDAGTGTLISSSVVLGGIYDDVGTDGQGNVYLWADTQASNDVRSHDATGTVRWTSTINNIQHSGSSVNRMALDERAGRSRLLVMSGGRLSRVDQEAATPVTDGYRWDGAADVIFPAQNGLHMYYADGGPLYSRYNATTDAAEAWTASAGSMPVDTFGRGARLICTWRGRTVLSGIKGDPFNWFMSRRNDPRDWGYGADFTAPGDPVSGNNSPMGLIGDIVTALCPYNDDLLYFGGDHTIWRMTGDPSRGGDLDNVSDVIGFAFGRPFCRGPDGTLFFFAQRGGVHTLVPGAKPVRLGQAVNRRLEDVDTGTNIIRMAWDEKAQGLHVYITPLDKTEVAEHWFWEGRLGAWWPVEFVNKNHNPKALWAYDDDDPDDRKILIGSWDSYVRVVDNDAGDDDGFPISSHVLLGPVVSQDLAAAYFHELQAVFGAGSGDVDFQVLSASSAEAVGAVPTVGAAGTFRGATVADPTRPLRSLTKGIRWRDHAIYVKLSSSHAWAFEQLRARLERAGDSIRRGT